MAGITIASRKAKGRRFQQWVVALFLRVRPDLTNDDVRSCSMGSNGADVLFSAAGKEALPYSIECKAHATGYAKAYAAIEQADRGDGLTPLAFVKEDRKRPLAIVYADDLEKILAKLAQLERGAIDITDMGEAQVRALLFDREYADMMAAREAQRERIEAAIARDRSTDIECTAMTDAEFEAFLNQF